MQLLTNSQLGWTPLLATVVLAMTFWFVTFYLTWGSFLVKMSLSAATLAGLSVWLQKDSLERPRLDAKAVLVGLVSAVSLYLIFFAGETISTALFPFAEDQIGQIYGKAAGTPLWALAVLSLFVAGPGEELYWRGYLQRQLMRRFGGWQGWLMGTALYASAHLWSFNFMLIGAATVAGAFWGAIYWRFGSLSPVIISHSVWSAVIFAVLPLA